VCVYIYTYTQSKHQDISLAKGNHNGMWLMSKQKFIRKKKKKEKKVSLMVAHVN